MSKRYIEFVLGDRVIRISGSNNGMEPKDKGTVTGVFGGGYLRIAEFRGLFLHEPERFKLLVKAE